jgi:glutathione synthase/RimK-type ligase-like ATP-grasp enzyme
MKRFAKVRTKNATARPLRHSILTDKRVVVRLGSLTPTSKVFPTSRDVIEINTVEAIQNSRDKLRMKECFAKLKIPQVEWFRLTDDLSKVKFPLVGKAICGFQGRGMKFIENKEQLAEFIRSHSNDNYFIERYFSGSREFRLHATRDEVFLSWRKLRTNDTKERWFFNSHNCHWVGENHELFNKPSNWDQLCAEACKAITAVGLNIGAVDLRVSSKDTSQFIILETNSAPTLMDIGIEKYKEVIQKLINNG